MSDPSDITDMRNALKGKIDNSVLLLADADSFLWLRQEGYHDANPFLGGGNWLILLGALSVLNLLGKISFIGDARLEKCKLSLFTGKCPDTKELGKYGVSEKEGFVNLNQIGGWGITKEEAKKFWQENRNPLAHLGYPGMGAGVVDCSLGDYATTVKKIKEGHGGLMFFELPLTNSPKFANSDLLVNATRDLIPHLKRLVEEGSDEDIVKVYSWCTH